MFPVVSPYIADARNNNPDFWAAKRMAVLAAVYPDGALTGFPDVIEENWGATAVPGVIDTEFGDIEIPGLASITRYTLTNSGGRSGGTPSYCHFLIPMATPVNKCLLFHAGHGTAESAWHGWSGTAYIGDISYSFILRMLARGWHVLAVDLPNYGLQPKPQTAVVNGSLSTQTNYYHHVPRGIAGPYDAPSITRLYTDHTILAMNQIDADHPGIKWALAGHSGGAAVGAILSALDSRFLAFHSVQSSAANPNSSYGTSDCWEGYAETDIGIAAHFGKVNNLPDIVRVGSSFPSRKTVMHVADADYGDLGYPEEERKFHEWVTNTGCWWQDVGSSMIYYHKTEGDHWPDEAQAAYIEAHLVANT